MSLDTIWDEPIASPPAAPSANGDANPQKRPRQSLFLSDSDSDEERPPKRATPAPPPARPDVDALFEDLDKEWEDDDLRYKPLAPALDLAKLAKEAEARHARAGQTAPSQTQPLAGGSKIVGLGSAGMDEGKSKPGDGDKKGRRVIPKLDEERLVGPEGFPLLIKEIKGFQPKGKRSEHADLNRLLQIYQYWTHKMYPKMSFKDTINRVEKLCHSKRMQVRLSVWRDEFKGVSKDEKAGNDSDVIDLTEPTVIGTGEDGDDKESEGLQLKSNRASSRTPSLPPASSEVEDDDFDIDAVIRAEEERLATLRATTADSGPPPMPLSPMVPEKTPSRSDPDANAMDLDDANLWDAVDDPGMLFGPLPSNPPAPPDDDNDMWDIVDQMEQGGKNRLAAESRMPSSGVNLTPSLDSANSGNITRATNDDDWDEMYS